MGTLKIGYKASAEQFGPAELVDLAVLAEDVGLDSVWVSDHFLPWRVRGGHAPNSLVWLGAVAARTSRVTLGTSVLTPTYRWNPALVAQAFATLADLAPERVVLGVGTGEALNEVAVGAVGDGQWPPFKERFARLREAVDLIRRLWSEDRVDHDGEHYHLRGAMVPDRPAVAPRVFVAGAGPLVARYAGRAGDGFIATSGKGMSLYADDLLPAVAAGEEVAGRPVGTVERMLEVKLSWDPSPQDALENTRFWAPLSLTAEQKHSIHDPAEMEAAADALPIEQVAKRWIVASTPDDVVAALAPYVELGFTHLVVHGPGHDQRRFLTTFARDVLPALHHTFARTP